MWPVRCSNWQRSLSQCPQNNEMTNPFGRCYGKHACMLQGAARFLPPHVPGSSSFVCKFVSGKEEKMEIRKADAPQAGQDFVGKVGSATLHSLKTVFHNHGVRLRDGPKSRVVSRQCLLYRAESIGDAEAPCTFIFASLMCWSSATPARVLDRHVPSCPSKPEASPSEPLRPRTEGSWRSSTKLRRRWPAVNGDLLRHLTCSQYVLQFA